MAWVHPSVDSGHDEGVGAVATRTMPALRRVGAASRFVSFGASLHTMRTPQRITYFVREVLIFKIFLRKQNNAFIICSFCSVWDWGLARVSDSTQVVERHASS